MPAPSYSFENYFYTGEPASDLMNKIEARLTDAGWVFVEQVLYTASSTSRVMRIWQNPASLNANGADFYLALIRNTAVGQAYFVARIYETWNTTTKTFGRPTLQPLTYGSQSWFDCQYANGTFLMVGPFNNATAYNSTVAAISTDGYNWKNSRLPAAAPWSSVAYGAGTWVAVAGQGAQANGSAFGANTAIAASSTDNGATWTQRAMPSSNGWSSVCYGSVPALFVAVSFANGTAAASSPDGITWTARTMPSTAQWCSVAYGNGTYVAVAATSGTTYATSTNGTTWTSRTTLPTNTAWYAVTYGNNQFVAVGANTTIATSPDGITWTARTTSYTNYNGVSYGNGYYVATRSNSGAVAPIYSTDGVTWTASTNTTAVSSPVNINTLYQGHPAYGNGVWVIPSSPVGTNVSGAVYVFTDPTTAVGTCRGVTNHAPYALGDYTAINPDPSTVTLGSTQAVPAAFEVQAAMSASVSYDIAILASKSYLAVSVSVNGTGNNVFSLQAGAFQPAWSDPLSTNPAVFLMGGGQGGTTRTMRSNPDDGGYQMRVIPTADGIAVGTHTAATKDPVSQTIKGVRCALAGGNTSSNGFTFQGALKGWMFDAVLIPVNFSQLIKTGDTVTIGTNVYVCFGTVSASLSANAFYGLFISPTAGS